MTTLIWMLLLVQPAPALTQASAGELDYARGTLAYDALVSRDFEAAKRQLEQASALERADPAWLINYAQVMAATGRTEQAERALKAAMRAPDGEIVLSADEVVSSREAARMALKRLRLTRLASR